MYEHQARGRRLFVRMVLVKWPAKSGMPATVEDATCGKPDGAAVHDDQRAWRGPARKGGGGRRCCACAGRGWGTRACGLAATRSVGGVAVDRSWRSADRRWLVDQVVGEPGVQFRVWNAEGAPVADVADLAELSHVLDRLGIDQDDLEQVTVADEWCE